MKALPLTVKRTMRLLGSQLKDARRRRRIPVALMAERANISRTTLNKIEKGDPSVSMGYYGAVIFIIGLDKDLAKIGNLAFDTSGQILVDSSLPRRIHIKRDK